MSSNFLFAVSGTRKKLKIAAKKQKAAKNTNVPYLISSIIGGTTTPLKLVSESDLGASITTYNDKVGKPADCHSQAHTFGSVHVVENFGGQRPYERTVGQPKNNDIKI